MVAVGKTQNGFKFIRISSHTPKNIQEGKKKCSTRHETNSVWYGSSDTCQIRVAQNINIFTNNFSTPLLNVLRGMWWDPDKFEPIWSFSYSAHSTWKISGPLDKSEKNSSDYSAHGNQNDRLELVFEKYAPGPEILAKRLKICRFGLVTWILAHSD